MTVFNVGVANMQKDWPGDGKYLAMLEGEIPCGYLLLCERQKGRKSVRVRLAGAVKGSKQAWRNMGQIGAHKAIAVRKVKVRGASGKPRKIKAVSFHALHVGSTSRKAQDRYYRKLRNWVRRQEKRGWEVALGGDCNRNPKVVGRYLGMKSRRHGIIGLFLTDGLAFDEVWRDSMGKRAGLTDHGELFATVRVK